MDKKLKQLREVWSRFENSESPFAVFVLAPFKDGWAATTRAQDRGESGRIGLPGGKVDPGENPVSAAIRESEEDGWKVFNVDPNPIHRAIVDGRMVWWFKAENSSPLKEYKEKNRGIMPIKVSLDRIAKSGYGNEFLVDYKNNFNEGSRSLKRAMRRKQSLAKKASKGDMPDYKGNPKEGARAHSKAFHLAQRMNSEGEKSDWDYSDAAEKFAEYGTDEHKEKVQMLKKRFPVRIFHMISPNRATNIIETLNYLYLNSSEELMEDSDSEISVSVKKGVWNVEGAIVLSGLARLSSYYPTDVYTKVDPESGLKVAMEPGRSEDSHHWDEATVRIGDVLWDKGYVGEEVYEQLGMRGAEAVEKHIQSLGIELVKEARDLGGVAGQTADDESDLKDAEESYYREVETLIELSREVDYRDLDSIEDQELKERLESEFERLSQKTPDDFAQWEVDLFGVQDKIGEVQRSKEEVERLISEWENLIRGIRNG